MNSIVVVMILQDMCQACSHDTLVIAFGLNRRVRIWFHTRERKKPFASLAGYYELRTNDEIKFNFQMNHGNLIQT